MSRRRAVTLVADPPWKLQDDLPGPGRGAAKHYPTLSVEELKAFPLPRIPDDARLFLWRLSSMPHEALEVARAWGFVPKSEIVWIKIRDLPEPDAPVRELRTWARLTIQAVAGRLAGEFGLASFEGLERAVRRLEAGQSEMFEREVRGILLAEIVRQSRDVRIGMGRQVRLAHEVCIIATRGRPPRLAADVPSVIYAPRTRHSAKPAEFYELVERLSPGPRVELFARQERRGWTTYGNELEEAHP